MAIRLVENKQLHNFYYRLSKPWIIDALICHNIYDEICNRHITVDQLSRLTEGQVISIIQNLNNEDIRLKMENYIESNQKQTISL